MPKAWGLSPLQFCGSVVLRMQLAFLASVVSPKVASAAAQKALEVLASEDISTAGLEDYLSMEETSSSTSAAAAASDPAAAAAAGGRSTAEGPPSASELAPQAAGAKGDVKAENGRDEVSVKLEALDQQNSAAGAPAAVTSNGLLASPFGLHQSISLGFAVLCCAIQCAGLSCAGDFGMCSALCGRRNRPYILGRSKAGDRGSSILLFRCTGEANGAASAETSDTKMREASAAPAPVPAAAPEPAQADSAGAGRVKERDKAAVAEANDVSPVSLAGPIPVEKLRTAAAVALSAAAGRAKAASFQAAMSNVCQV